MLTSTGRELTVVGYRPANSTDTERLRRENDRLRRAMRAERRKRMAAYEQALRKEEQRKHWFRDHRSEILLLAFIWHAIEMMSVCALAGWLIYMFAM